MSFANRLKAIALICLLFPIHFGSYAGNEDLSPLRSQLDELCRQYRAGAGIALISLRSGDTMTLNNRHAYPMQSVYKFPLAMAVLDRVDKGKLTLEQRVFVDKKDLHVTWSPFRDKHPEGNIEVSIADLLYYSVAHSDNNTTDILFRLMGGPRKVRDYIWSLGIHDIKILSTEDEMHQNHDLQYKNTSTPLAMARLLEGLSQGRYLSEKSTAWLLKTMTETTTGPNRIKGLLPEGTVVVHKTGSSGQDNNGITAATNDVGIITLPDGQQLVLVVFVSESKETDETNERIIAEVSRVVYAYFTENFKGHPALPVVNEKITLADKGRSNYTIVLCPDADSNDRKAATTFQQYFFRATGVTLAITGNIGKGRPAVYLASRGRENGLPYRIPSYLLKEDGYQISTFGQNILIFGGGGKGLQYGVARFLEKELGCRKFSDTEEWVPSVETLSIQAIREVQNPAFQYRSNSTRDPSYIDWHGLNTHNDVWGMFVHTFDRLIPPDEYFKSHPEYFSLLPAGRVPDAQLCLSNPDVLRIIIEKLKIRMKEQPQKKYWSVSQNDTYSPCGCSECLRLDEMYGGPSGTMIWFVNQVAEAFPDKEISTLAYQYTRAAPKNIVPAKNVNIFLCSIECDRSKPLTEHPNGKPFVKDVEDWSRLTSNIMIWDYIIRYRSMLSPFPNFPVLKPNLQFFRDRQIAMVFEQGPGRLGSSEFSELRSMITAKLLWNPDLDVDSIITDFCDHYYGMGGPMIHAYINKMNSELKASGEDLGIYGTPQPSKEGYLSNENLQHYAGLFDQAEAATASDPLTLERVRIARLPLMYAQLEIAKILGAQPGGFYTEKAEGQFEVRKDLLVMLDTFDTRCTRHKIKALHEMGLNPKEYYGNTVKYLSSNYIPNYAYTLGVKLDPPASPKYSHGIAQVLTDGLVGLDDYNLNWIGWEGEDMNATIDLGKMTLITKISVNFAQDINSWIFMPQEVEFLISEDGKAYQSAGIVKSTTDPKKGGFISETYAKDVQAVTRYIRISALNQKACPLWHKGAGGKCWIFADEIRVN